MKNHVGKNNDEIGRTIHDSQLEIRRAQQRVEISGLNKYIISPINNGVSVLIPLILKL